MADTKKKLQRLLSKKTDKKSSWDSLVGKSDPSGTRHKLEELVKRNLKNKTISEPKSKKQSPVSADRPHVSVIENFYPFDSVFNGLALNEWKSVNPALFSDLFPEQGCKIKDPLKLLYFDTETTGLAGGSGTLAFMCGFGFFTEYGFTVKIFVLNDISRETELLDMIDNFIGQGDFEALVTYNGRTYDVPLMETRYILNRKRSPLSEMVHLDFLFPARKFWRNTYESRSLGYLGDMILGLSREDDIGGEFIPAAYFAYLRTGDFSKIEDIASHNALDLVGLSLLMLYVIRIMGNTDLSCDPGEMFGAGLIFEKSGRTEQAEAIFKCLADSEQCDNPEISDKALVKLSDMKKKEHQYDEAAGALEKVNTVKNHKYYRELAVYYEHRAKDPDRALLVVSEGLGQGSLTECQRRDFCKREARLLKKIAERQERISDQS